MRRVLPIGHHWPTRVGGAAGLALGLVAGLAAPVLAGERALIDPWFDLDWSVGLRGTYQTDGASQQAKIVLAPEVTLSHQGVSDEATLRAGAALAADGIGSYRPEDVHVGAAGRIDPDALTSLDGSLDLSLDQLAATDSSLPTGTMIAPLEFTGTASGTASRQMGHFKFTGRLEAERFIRGDTTLADSSTIDNASDSYWRGVAGLRVGFELTPLVSVFVDGSETYKAYDAASPSSLAYLDGRTSELQAGVSYKQNSTLTMEASVGRAWLDYVDPSLTDAPTWVYNASLDYAPDETLRLKGGLETSIGPSADTPGDTDVDYALTASAAYQVNPWVKLRGSGGWNRTLTLGSGAAAGGYDLGAGFDLMTSPHSVWSADYLYAHDFTPPGPASDTHTVTLGLTVKR